jgi:hypothetical protein
VARLTIPPPQPAAGREASGNGSDGVKK